MKVGNAHAKLAETSRVADPAERLARWRAAQTHYRRSLDIFLAMQSRDQIKTGADISRIDQLGQALARCEAALRKQI